MIYVNDCSIRVVRSFIKSFVQIFHTSFCIQKLFYNEKKKLITVHAYCRVVNIKKNYLYNVRK